MKSKSEFIKYLIELILIGIIFVSLFIKSFPILPIAFAVIVIQFYRLGLVANVVMSFLFLPLFFGSLLNGIGIRGIGGYFLIFGAFLLIYGLFTKKIVINKYFNGLIYLMILLFVFYLSLALTTGGDWALNKWILTIQTGLISFVAFLVLFSNIQKVDKYLFGIYLILYSFFLLRISVFVNHINGPASFFDFGFMRYQTTESFGYNSTVFAIEYHIPGYFALQGVALMMIQKNKKINNSFVIFSLFLAILVALYSGARQTIVIGFFLLFLWSILYFKSKWLSSLFLTLFSLGVLWIIFSYNQDIHELFRSTVHQGYVEGGGRGPWLLRGIELFLSRPIFGVGFGRYSLWGIYGTYPHNIIIEMLCEIGIFGFIVSILLILPFLLKARKIVKSYIFYLTVLVLQAMVSGGLESNIIIFSFIFALPNLIQNFNQRHLLHNRRVSELVFNKAKKDDSMKQ